LITLTKQHFSNA